MLVITLMAVVIGVIGAFIALILLRLITFFTNLFFFQRLGFAAASPADNKLGLFIIIVPVIGGLIIGLMARYGSDRIRGHGIPEAIESILINGSRIDPKVAILKPLSSAISIGSGGPFGAEGPIIMTGGAVGSLIAQFFHLTSSERKTLLVAGAAAGMAATFAAPVAAALLAVELLLFEWKPRSAIPVALASAAAAVVRRYIIGEGPLFPVPPHASFIGPQGVAGCIVAGLLAGALSALMTIMVYFFEDTFTKLPIHWMWWPAIGGVAIGIGGLVFPQALGVGYDTIALLLQGNVASATLLGILVVKSLIWSISLGSGTSGGVLAPLLMMGGALGGLEALVLPHEGAGFWVLVSMGAILGGTMRSPFTGIIFALELTHDVNALLPLTIAGFIAYAFTALLLKRSILTEKISRRGFHLSREYAVDPLEIIFVREVMRTNIVAVSADASPEKLAQSINAEGNQRGQYLYPVMGTKNDLIGVVTRQDLRGLLAHPDGQAEGVQLAALIRKQPVVAYPDEPLRVVVFRMAETGLTRFPVVERDDPRRLLGIVSLNDLLRARERNLEEERHRERVLRLRFFRPLREQPQETTSVN
jgi:CIC family chloride channel protein